MSVKQFIISVLLLFGCISTVTASGISKYKIIKVSGEDHTAVIKAPGEEMRVIREGDTLAHAEITEIVTGRIVLKDPASSDTIILRYADGQQRKEVHHTRGYKKPSIIKSVKTKKTE